MYSSLRKYAKNVTDFEKKKRVTVNKKKLKSMQDAELCYFCWKRLINNYTDKKRGEILVVFCNGCNYDYYFIIKELVKKCEGQFECLWKNNKNHKAFSVPIEK